MHGAQTHFPVVFYSRMVVEEPVADLNLCIAGDFRESGSEVVAAIGRLGRAGVLAAAGVLGWAVPSP